MPKKLFILSTLFFYSTFILGQNCKQPNIIFDTDYFNAVDHWVVLPEKATDSTYLLGYVYLDEIMGFTLFCENTITINNKEWIVNSTTANIIKTTLDKMTPLVYLLSANDIEKMHLPEKPQWLKVFDSIEKSTDDLVLIGYQYNAVGKSDLAIPFLKKAFAKKPKTKNLAFELSFAFNAIADYEKAIAVLNLALQYDDYNYMLYRELGYALLKIEKIEDAEKAYEKGLSLCDNEIQKRDIALDMAQTFFHLKDIEKFKKWAAILKNDNN
ncbi:hypothetical protein [Flavobacterium sp.]|uniref:tetratricopeptide repeat protein n=1 Tax=Flavobacterium sp. TaxID=239 RepID=UPI002869FCD4|nr:hypothetical protein [Flavobacterium sp.]